MKRKIGSLGEIVKNIPADGSIKEKARAAYLMLGANSFYNTQYDHLFGYPQLEIFNESDAYTTPNIRCM